MATIEIPEQQFNIPARVDPESLDIIERWVAAGVMTAASDLTANAFAALRPVDFEHAALETVVRAVDRTLRAGKAKTPSNITTTAVEHGFIIATQQVEFERLLHELLETSSGAAGIFQVPASVYRGSLRSLTETGTRSIQLAEKYSLEQKMIEQFPFTAAGAAISEAARLADAADALAEQLHATARRLRQHVAPIDEFTARRLASRPGVRVVRQVVSA
ncbi:hypothetical protein [Brachybacterium alimentarium]|uniref:hypothetical protein n=1 Tax=Brachybacterium alimentarium TaxID=47845 RepID=UPI000DF33BB1|nr:hypothetical protein [Brachybacterium alimentarium]RCS67671.1 hypothetical protein CIK68_14235 [Brachybacterium alimentarium]